VALGAAPRKAITPPPLPERVGRGDCVWVGEGVLVNVGGSGVGMDVGDGVWVSNGVLVGVGGSEVAIDGALPHPLNRNNNDKANLIIFFIGMDG
jgi:hypothetical protein